MASPTASKQRQPGIEPYTIKQAQDMVRAAVAAAQPRHDAWRIMEHVVRTGSLDDLNISKTAETSERGRAFINSMKKETVNLLLPHLSLMRESVVSREPSFVVTPFGGGEDAEAAAGTAKAVVDYYWQRLGVTPAIQDATEDLLKLGSGFLKTGWNTIINERSRTPAEFAERLAQVVQEDALNAVAEGRDPLSEEEIAEAVGATVEEVILSEPYVIYASPYDIFVDPLARRLGDARWVCHRVSLPVDEVKANPAYSNTDDLMPNSEQPDKYAAEAEKRVDKKEGTETDLVTIYEFYDTRTRRMLVFQINAEKPLYDDVFTHWHRYPPFIHLRGFSGSGSEFWPFGDVENVARLQGMFNEMLQEQLDNARRAGAKHFIDERALTPEVKTGLESDVPEIIIPMRPPSGMGLQDILQTVRREALSGDVYAAKQELDILIQRVLGINEFQAGGVGADRMSATAAAVVDGIATLRAQGKIETVERAVAEAGTHILLLSQQYADLPTVVRVASPQGAMWGEFTREDIQGEYIIRVEGGSMRSLNPQALEQRGLRLLTQVLPVVAQLQFDPVPVLREALRDLGFSPDTLLVPQQNPPGQVPPGAPTAAQQPLEGGAEPGAPPADVTQYGGPPDAALAQLLGGLTI